MFDQDIILAQIADLQSQIDCIKSGDCCSGMGADTTIYSIDGIFGTTRKGNITDTLTFYDLVGVTALHQFSASGNTGLSLNTGLTGIGVATPLAKLHVVANGNAINNALLVQSSTSAERLSVREDGRIRNFSTIPEDFGAGVSLFVSGNGYAGLLLTNTTSTTSNIVYGANIGVLAAPTATDRETYIAVAGSTGYDGTIRTVGVYGETHASLLTLGLFDDGAIVYGVGVKGNAGPRTAALGSGADTEYAIGGYFAAGQTADLTTTGNYFIGSLNEAIARQGTATLVATMCRTKDITPVTNTNLIHIALLVPSTNNDGTVVFGADLPSVNKTMLEVTGDMEVINLGGGVILKSPDGTRWRMNISNFGVVAASLA